MPVDELLKILRTEPNAKAAWSAMIDLLSSSYDGKLWHALPQIDIRPDVTAAVSWLQASLDRVRAPLGVYLGLDTLNMKGGAGHNVELGWTPRVNIEAQDADWIYDGLEYGPKHLIEGLLALHSVYSRGEWAEVYSPADYLLPLGYAGVVLREALRAAKLQEPLLAAWGFHDGDMFLLGRMSAGGFVTLAQ